VDDTISVSEGAEGAIAGDVQREAVAPHMWELFNYMARILIKAFCADNIITAPGQN
jgi:hypothetical protein